MTSALDKSLDDLIKTNKRSKSGGRGGGGGGGRRPLGPGPSRRFKNRGAPRTAPYAKPLEAPESAWQHDMFMDHDGAASFPPQAGRPASLETGTKLLISNLDYGVSTEDIKELFSEVGDLKRHTVHYDRSGRSKGTAEVVYSRRSDAVAAVKRYNNVQLDGKPMKVDFVGTNIAAPAALPPASSGMYGRQNGAFRSQRTSGGSGRAAHGGGGGGGRGGRRGRGRGRGQGEKEKVSAEDLDADLEKYHSGAMQIN